MVKLLMLYVLVFKFFLVYYFNKLAAQYFRPQMFHRLNGKALSEKLAAEPVTFWLNLLKTYFIEKPYALVLGYPSKTEQKTRSIMEEERIENRKATLKESGLLEKKEILEKANAENQVSNPIRI